MSLALMNTKSIWRDQVEGNLFGSHHSDPATYPQPGNLLKRRGVALFAVTRKRILEVGFNAGHSALLMLTVNKELIYTGVDICMNPYVMECYNYLKSQFGDRLNLMCGDSRKLVPALLETNNRYDGYIIDGGHNLSIAFDDMENVIAGARNGSILCIDDAGSPNVRVPINYHMLTGDITNIVDAKGYLSANNSMFFKINKAKNDR
jgi:predicted O-methyltransferase YrrM